VPDKPTRPLATALVLAACIAFAMPGATPAFGQVPERSATVGQPFSYTGLVYSHLSPGYPQLLVDPDHDKCGGLSAGVHWGDFGALTPVPYPAESSLVAIPGGWNVLVSASYTYQAPKPKSTGGASVDIEITCDGQLQKESYLPWVTVTVTGAGAGGSLPPGSPPPGSCPLGQTTSFVRISQASCPIQYTPALGKAEKKIFRQLAGIAYKGYVVDKAIDDVVSFPGKAVSEGFFGKNAAADLVIGKFWGDYLERLVAGKGAKGLFGKATPYGWILNAPKYASYLDYVKYAALTRLADDPPDPNFTALASPPKLPGLRGAPRQVGQRDRREAALYIALLTTVERAAGAEAAGATAAQSAQLRHASGIANQLVSLLGEKQKALKAGARTVRRMPAGRLPRGVVRRAQRRLGSRSLTPSLRKLGFTRDEIAEVRQSAPSVPLKSLTAPFQTVLGLGAEAKTVGRERAMLATFAKRHARGG
jgi:hypothetical protein